MKILVTGGAGYIGCHLVTRLLAAGHQVTVYDRLDYGGQGLLANCGEPGFWFIKGDVTDRDRLREIVPQFDAVVHLAARVGFPACQADPQDAVASNVGGTSALIAEMHPGQRLVFASTASVYGAAGTQTDETRPVAPLSLYARTKVTGEHLVRTRGDDTVILRFSTAFGVSPRMRFDLLPNDLIRIMLRDGRLDLYEPHFRRSFIHVADIAAALHHALDHWAAGVGGQTFNVSDPGLDMTKLQLAELAGTLLPCKLNVVPDGHDSDARDYYLSAGRFAATGFTACSDMRTALRAVITAAALTGAAA